MRALLILMALVLLKCSSSEVETVSGSVRVHKITQPNGSCFYIRSIMINGINLYYRCDEQGNIMSGSLIGGKNTKEPVNVMNGLLSGSKTKVLLEEE